MTTESQTAPARFTLPELAAMKPRGDKIVMVTAIGEQVNEITSPLYGADAHIDKPFEFDRLEKVIAGLVSGS